MFRKLMKLGILFSGGKDSTLALHKSAEKEQATCLITIRSRNPESYMFHTPNIGLTELQAQALDLPLIVQETQGNKEEELFDLEQAIKQAVRQFDIEGVVTGAVESVYQAERVQRICNRLDLWCFNPLWKMNQQTLLEELLKKDFQVIISGVFAYPLDERWLGKQIDYAIVSKLVELQRKYGISPSGEGGEIETTVLNGPMFKQKIEVTEYNITARDNAGVFRIKQARLIPK
jgi:ABC transporter with metal-binding/Fe-S-binding domain ATP-binding protein